DMQVSISVVGWVFFAAGLVLLGYVILMSILHKRMRDSYEKREKLIYRNGFLDGQLEILHELKASQEEEESDEEESYSLSSYLPDTSTWSDEIPADTKEKLAQEIATFNRTTAQRKRMESNE